MLFKKTFIQEISEKRLLFVLQRGIELDIKTKFHFGCLDFYIEVV